MRPPPDSRRRRRARRRLEVLIGAVVLAAAVLGLLARGAGPGPTSGAPLLPVPVTTRPPADLWGPVRPDAGVPGASVPGASAPGAGAPGAGAPGAGATDAGATDAGGTFTGTLRGSDAWLSLFAEQWAQERPVAERLATSGDSWDQYDLAYDVDALTAAYLAGGRSEYVDEGLTLLEHLVGTARPATELGPDDDYHDDFLGWVTQQADDRGKEVPLYESYLWRYAVGLLRIVRADPVLWEDPNRQARYTRLLEFTERDIFFKWRTRGSADSIYRSRTHMAAHWALIALGLSRITTDPQHREAYLETVRAIDTRLPNYPSSLRGQLRMNPRFPTAYTWDDTWGDAGHPGQDVAHGNAVIAYVVVAHAARHEWTSLDMSRFIDTFTLAVWPLPPRSGQPEGAEYVDGTGRGDGWFSDGFVKLGRFDPVLQQRLERHDVGRSPQFIANGALNVALLSCQGVAPASAAPRDSPACRVGAG